MARCGASRLALGLVVWTLRLLIGLCCCTFLFYCVAITCTVWLHSSAFRSLTRTTVFPFIAAALPECHPVSKHREYSSAVRHSRSMYLSRTARGTQYKGACLSQQLDVTLQVWFLWGLPFIAALLTILLRRACALCKNDHEGGPHQGAAKQQTWLEDTKSAVGLSELISWPHLPSLDMP